MSTVTTRIKEIRQPRGGYIPIKIFKEIELTDNEDLYDHKEENISPALLGTAVDNLTRYMITKNAKEAFDIAIKGASVLYFVTHEPQFTERVEELLCQVTGLDDRSITASVELSVYDSAYRAGPAIFFRSSDVPTLNKQTLHNIKTMVKRNIKFFDEYAPVIATGFDFEGAYTDKIEKGDGDYLSKDTLFDLKVSVKKPNKDHTLQILIYYLMGKKTSNILFESVSKIGIINPRLNKAYILNVDDINSEIIDIVNKEVIGY